MNERIKELADQCWDMEHYDEYLGHKEPLFRYTKFAEMIVRECVQVTRQHNFHERSLNAIYQHFGMDASEIFKHE